ncbi:Detected protein of unknown function [Hibiscus syriacus]|uniref:VQ domain-containing protein n=1 Tax=Hibiscus syriacus TaxID=106335 RepID=A0A6A2W819_HIBSY|nr:Detected protein of unknown function [Hibiscus syriacus]
MSPPRREVMMNGVRPTPLKISKESNVIQKPSSSADHPKQQQQKRQGPIIIYTHSPKIIHTQARDFMTLVQRLTGLSRPDRELDENTAPVVLATRPRKNDKVNRQEDNETSSWITDENGGSYVPTTTTVSGMNPFFADMPLFTPSSTDFFCSPRPVHMFGDMGTLNSPTLLEFLKGLPDY